MPLCSFGVMLSPLSTLLWASRLIIAPSHISFPYCVALRSSTWTMRSPAFLYIPFCEHTITLNSDDLAYPDYLAYSLRSYALVLCDYRFHPFRKAHQSHWCNEACVFTLAHYGLLARYQRTRIQTSRFISSRGTIHSIRYRPNSQLAGWNFSNWYIKASWRT